MGEIAEHYQVETLSNTLLGKGIRCHQPKEKQKGQSTIYQKRLVGLRYDL